MEIRFPSLRELYADRDRLKRTATEQLIAGENPRRTQMTIAKVEAEIRWLEKVTRRAEHAKESQFVRTEDPTESP